MEYFHPFPYEQVGTECPINEEQYFDVNYWANVDTLEDWSRK
jgi:homoserine trans-succinylase